MSTLLERPLVELSRKNLSICILDDEADHVELTSRRLEAAGFPVSGTTNAEEALQRVCSGSCRVVVADLKMPGMDGLAFLEKALQCDPGMYVILVTGFYAVDSAIEAIKHGAYDYLCKPIDYTRLLKTLDDLRIRLRAGCRYGTWRTSCWTISCSTGLWGAARRCSRFSIWRKKSRGTTPTR